MVSFERALVSSIVTFPLIFTRFRDIAAFVLQIVGSGPPLFPPHI